MYTAIRKDKPEDLRAVLAQHKHPRKILESTKLGWNHHPPLDLSIHFEAKLCFAVLLEFHLTVSAKTLVLATTRAAWGDHYYFDAVYSDVVNADVRNAAYVSCRKPVSFHVFCALLHHESFLPADHYLVERIIANGEVRFLRALADHVIPFDRLDALGKAVEKQKQSCIDFLLEEKIDVNAPKPYYPQTCPLITAALQGNYTTLKKLLDAGADPNIKSSIWISGNDQESLTALMVCAYPTYRRHKHPTARFLRCARLLVARGARTDTKTKNTQHSALQFAVAFCVPAVVDFLLQNGCHFEPSSLFWFFLVPNHKGLSRGQFLEKEGMAIFQQICATGIDPWETPIEGKSLLARSISLPWRTNEFLPITTWLLNDFAAHPTPAKRKYLDAEILESVITTPLPAFFLPLHVHFDLANFHACFEKRFLSWLNSSRVSSNSAELRSIAIPFFESGFRFSPSVIQQIFTKVDSQLSWLRELRDITFPRTLSGSNAKQLLSLEDFNARLEKQLLEWPVVRTSLDFLFSRDVGGVVYSFLA